FQTHYKIIICIHITDDPANPEVSMGAAWYNCETGVKMKHKVTGRASSTNPEALAVLSVIEACPPNRTINISTDSQSVYFSLKSIIDGHYDNIPLRHIIKKPEWPTWEAIYLSIREKNIQC